MEDYKCGLVYVGISGLESISGRVTSRGESTYMRLVEWLLRLKVQEWDSDCRVRLTFD